MMQGMIRILEHVIDKYYAVRNGVFVFCSAVFLVIIVCGVHSLREQLRYVINKLLHKALYTIGIACIGSLLCLLGLAFQIEYRYFDAVFFILVVGFIMLYEGVQCAIFLKIEEPMLQLCRYVQYVIFFELFLLAMTQRLEPIEEIVGTAAVVCIETILLLSEKRREEQEEREEEAHTKESDYSSSDLFDTRQRQLERFIPILRQQRNEPYAVMISGEWGIGKSSFIKGLEKQMTEDRFIWVQAGSEKTVSEIMLEISEQVLEILRENNIFIENGNAIERYFLAFSGLLDEAGLGFWDKISHMLGSHCSGGDKSQRYINSKLKKLSKTIYLVIDDLDRCDKEYQLKMFRVIRESTSLTNCKTIFLVDKAMFLTEDCNVGYIEKYVNYTLDLCPVNYEEIANYFIWDVFDDETVQSINEVLLSGRNAEVVRNSIHEFPVNILKILNDEAEKTGKDIQGKSENDKKIMQNKLNDIRETILEIENNIKNSRKVKNYLKGVKRNLAKLSDGIEQCGAEYLKEDWVSAVVEVEFIKYILPERFADIQACADIYEFLRKYTGYAVNIVLGVRSRPFDIGRREEILNYIIYKLDIINFSEVKTSKEKYLNELRKENTARFNHMNDYVGFAESYGDYEEILKLYDARQFKNDTDKESFIRTIMKNISDVSSFPKANTREFLDFSKKLIAVLMKNGLTEKQRNICINAGGMIVRKTLLENSLAFKDILYVFFKTDRIERAWTKFDVMDVDEFYKILMTLDERKRFDGLHSGTDNLLNIEAYYGSIEEEVKKEEYKEIQADLGKKFQSIHLALEICKLWRDIDVVLNETEDMTDTIPLFERYFTLNGPYSFRQEAFDNIDALAEALDVLHAFLETKTEHYDSKISRMLLQVVYRVVLLYDENIFWFQSEKTGIEEILEKVDVLAKRVYQLDLSEDEDDKEVIDEIKIFVYRLHCLYTENESKASAAKK